MKIPPAAGSAWIAVLSVLAFLVGAPDAHTRQIDFLSSGPPRDRFPPPRVGTGTLTGRVVDGATGAPVPRARVRLYGGGGLRPSVITDASGNFVFAGLPAGPYTLTVDKASYQSARYPDRGRGLLSSFKPVMLQDGQTIDSIGVSLYRGGVIAGRVVDANGEPVERALVRAFKAPRAGGRPVPGNAVSTNDLGEFRLAGLETGSYLLMALSHGATVPDEPGSDGKPQPQPQPAPTYYPNVAAIDHAQAIPVQRGQTVPGTDITMGEVFMGTVTGTVIDPTGQPVTRNAQISIATVDSEVLGGGGSSSTGLRADGTFQAKVVPGDYIVEARFTPLTAVPGGEHDLLGREPVTVTSGGSETLLITLGAGATASGRVVFEGTSPLPKNPGQVRVPLVTANGRSCSASPAEIASDWSFTLPGLIGTCTGRPFGAGRWMLKAVIHAGEDLLDRPVTFTPGQQYRDVQVVFTDRQSEIGFHVSDEGGKATREYVAVVFPADKARWTVNPGSSAARAFVPPQPEMVMEIATRATTSRAPTPQPRRELMTGLRPGEYLAIALDNIEYEEMRDPAVLEKLAGAATRIVLRDDARLEVPLRRVKLSDAIR